MPNVKKKDDDNLIRQPRGDVATYKRDTHTGNSDVSRSSGSTTIVPRGGEIDQELKPQTEIDDVSLGEDQNERYMADGGFVDDQEPEEVPPPEPLTQPMAPAKPLAGMPPSVTPDEFEKYLGKQKSTINRFGPDQEMELQKSLNDRQGSLGYRVADAGKGFADALMQGVARAGNPGWQQQFEGQENERGKQQMDTLRHAQDTNLKQVETGMSLDKMNPNSELSKSTKQAYAPLMGKLGYPPSAIEKMSAADIGNAMSLMSDFGGKEKEALIKQYELEIERARLGQTTAKLNSDERMAQQKLDAENQTNQENRKIQAAKELAGQTANKELFGLAIPFTKNPTDASKVGTKYLEEAVNITPDVAAYAQKHNITPEQALQIKKSRGG